MKKTKFRLTRLLAMALALAMLIGMLPLSVLAVDAETESAESGLTVTDVTDQLTEEQRLQLFADNMNTDIVSEADIPAADEEVRVIVQLDEQSLMEVREEKNMESMSMDSFLNTTTAQDQLVKIQSAQASVLSQMEQAGVAQEVTFTYNAITSGFAAKIAYGDLEKVAAMDGVSDVILCDLYYPDVIGTASLGEALSGAEVAAYANSTEYQGEGMLIGILDTGLDWTHEAFANAPEVQKLTKDSLGSIAKYDFAYDEEGNMTGVTAYSYAALWYAQANSSGSDLALLTAEDLYKSAKVPFGFDYADYDTDVIPTASAVTNYGNDHGTHVAGIAAGKTVDEEGNVTFAGQAPEAQLAIFKVFSDKSSGASTDTLLAALNDAILLGVDVINMSLGSSGGFGAEEDDSVVQYYYDAVKAYGILLNTSGGNAYSSSYGGAQADYASTSDPDTGITGSPGSYDAALATASINTNETSTFTVGGQYVPYNDVSGYDFVALLLNGQDSATYDYVMVPGTGTPEDYANIDVTGKIAVVIRGGLSFNDKQLNAAAAGAVGCIIYNNKDGYLLNMAITDYVIPTVCISQPNGQFLAQQETKTLTVSATGAGMVSMSDFSSWGPLPSLELKPEITAPGGEIYSSLPFGQYGTMSGTSMASPYMAGTSAAALQYVNKVFPSLTIAEKRALVNQLLMSTADIVYDDRGVAYSPRKQGSGMVDLSAAISTPAYLYVKGDDKTKIELGDDPNKVGIYDLSFQVKNLTGSAVSYNINTLVQTETASADGKFILQAGYELDADVQIQVSGGTLEGNVLTVPGNGDANVVVTITLSDAAKAYMDATFENGIYVEGFVELTNEDDPSLSVPYLAFYGDWTQAPIFEEADYYNDEDVKMYATTPAGVYAMMYLFPLGVYPFNVPEGYEEPAPNKDLISLDLGSGNGISTLYYLLAGQLRGAKTTEVVITDADTGEILNTISSTNSRKSYYNSSTGAIRAGYVGGAWSGAGIPSGTRMNYTVTAYVDAEGPQKNKNNTYSFDFTSDSEMPYVVNRNDLKFYYGENGRVYLDVVMADNFALAGATLYSAVWSRDWYGNLGMNPGSNYYSGIQPAMKEDGSFPTNYEEYSYTFDVTDFYKNLTDGCFYIVAYDYALNECCLKVALDEIPVTALTLDTTETTLPTRGYVQLNATVTPDNATNQALVWSTSDAAVAEVKEGLVKAIAPGTATITVTADAYPDVSASCTITVTEEVGPDVPMEEIQLSYAGVSLYVGDTNDRVKLAAYSPYTATNYDLTWSSSDPSVATVDENGLITGISAGTCVVTATAVLGGATDSVNVTVKEVVTGGTGSFSIDGDVLVAYSGTEETVTVPEGIRVIGENAFKNNTSIQNVVLPATVEEIEYRAFYGCSNLETINLPETMVSLGEQIFYNCKKLTTLGLDGKGVIPKGLTVIPKGCFYNCNALVGELVIPEGVTTICQEAFYGCKAITSVTMANTVVSWGEGYSQFSGCSALTSVNLSENLTELPRNCFFSCTSLTALPDLKNITQLGNACFQHMDSATEITVPAQITYVGNLCFAYCDVLEKIHFEGSPELGTGVCSNNPVLTSVTGNLTTINDTMFEKCTGLVNFVVPDHVTYIGKKAFNNCTALESVIFPATYSAETLSLGETPFYGCKAFTGIVIEEGCTALKVADGMLFTGDGKKLISLPADFAETTFTVPDGVEVIGANLFTGNKNLTSVTFPDSLKVIEERAFYNCTKLTAIDLPDGVTTVGTYAFYGCTAVTDLDLGKSLQAVEPYTFNGMTKITSIILPDTVRYVGEYAFTKCNAATTIVIPEGVTSIGKYAFDGCKKVTSIILPSTLTEMGIYAFRDCNAATEINTGGLTEIPERAFYNCKAAKTVTLGDNVITIGNNAFYYGQKLTIDTWPATLETVGDNAFYMCNSLKNMDFSGTQLRTIGKNAFWQAKAVEVLKFPETLETIASKAFAYLLYGIDTTVTSIHLPASVTYVAADAFYYANRLQSITVDENNPVYTSSDGILIVKETGELYIWPMANTTTEFTVPANMTTIPAKMFQNNTSLKKVYIHSGVTYIGSSAFNGSKIEEFVFEPSANGLVIDSSAFASCDALTEIAFPYGTTALGDYILNSCDNLEKVYLPDTITEMGSNGLAYCTKLTDVHLPAGLATIPSGTFNHCEALKEITLPAGVSNCGITRNSSPFANCTSLENIWVEEGSLYYKSVDGVLYDYNGKTLRAYPMGRTAETYTIPEGTIRVGNRAALGNPYLKSVSFPSTLVRIGDSAFYLCENLKDFYFNGTTAPVLETTLSLTGDYLNYASYWNFVDKWMTVDPETYDVIPNELGLNLYYPEGAVGFDAYVWEIYFYSGTTNVMDASYYTVTNLTATEAEGRTVQLTWDAAKKADAEALTYTVERAIATPVTADGQDTWLYDEFETLAEGVTETAFHDETALDFGMGYAYQVTAYNAKGETGPAAVTTIIIAVDENNADEVAALAVIQAIESLKPIENLTLEDEARVQEVKAMYDALTDAQKALVPNLDTLEAALHWIDSLHAANMEQIIETLPHPNTVTAADAETIAAVRAAYEALTEAQKALVSNLAKLEACEDALTAQAVIALIAALPDPEDVTAADAEAIAAARTAYDALTEAQKEHVGNLMVRKLEKCEAALAALENLPFADVSEEAWYYEAVKYAYQNGLIKGTSDTEFAPSESASRGMLVTILYRLAGSPAVEGELTFTDVRANGYYAKAILWASQNGIARGYADGTFHPDASVTRAEMVTFLARYAEKIEGKTITSSGETLQGFVDSASVPKYARNTMGWAVENGIIQGVSAVEPTLDPLGTATRAQLAQILYNYLTQN